MSNFLAIATVTAALRSTLQAAMDTAAAEEPGAVLSATATSVRPGVPGSGVPARGINVYLYQIAPNAAWRNADLLTRDATGQVVSRPQAALDLSYLLSFYGTEGQLEPERLLGVATRTLHAQPVLTRQAIGDVLGDPLFSFLAGSDLAEAVERVRLTPLPLSLEELSKLWSVFLQVPYVLSVAYQASVVLVEGRDRARAILPVQRRDLRVVPQRRPHVDAVEALGGPGQPIVAGTTVRILGRSLRAEGARVLLRGEEAVPMTVSDRELRLTLGSPPLAPEAVRAGVQGLQVVMPLSLGDPATPHRGFESNAAAFVLRPRLSGPSAAGGALTLAVDPVIGASQRVQLLLDGTPGSPPDRHYTFDLPARLADTSMLTVPIPGVAGGPYFARLQVDGAQGPLDLDPASPTFGPLVTVP